MPELPDITIYVEALERRIIGERLDGVRIQTPFLLRTFDPPLDSVNGKSVREVRRLGKRIAIGLDDELWLVLHLMIAGRLHWKVRGVKLSGKSPGGLRFPERDVAAHRGRHEASCVTPPDTRRRRLARARPGRPRAAPGDARRV